MRKVAILIAVMSISVATGCSEKQSSQSEPVKAAKVGGENLNPAQMNDKELALAFLGGIQKGDKKSMYDMSNLTSELVVQSREKLTNSEKYKQSKKERAETEHALRMSGSIEFFLKKLAHIFPKSAQLQVVRTKKDASGDAFKNIHEVKVTYSNKEDALTDKTGKKAKEILLKLQQIKHVVNGVTLQEFVFDHKDFAKMADREFVVLSYY